MLYLPDELLVIDVHTRKGWRVSYDFTYLDKTTQGLPREGVSVPYVPLAEADLPFRRDHAEGEFAGKVERAKREFECGNLFEVVLSQTFGEACPDPPSAVFFRLRERNPSPYGFIINLGASEYLVRPRTRAHPCLSQCARVVHYAEERSPPFSTFRNAAARAVTVWKPGQLS